MITENKEVLLNRWQSKVWLDKHRYIVLDCGRRAGKALALDTPILTATGWKQMKDIEVGEVVYDEKGKQTTVLYTSPVFTDHDCYRITFSNGEVLVADAGHRWLVEAKEYRKNSVRNKRTTSKPIIKTTEEMSVDYKVKRSDKKVENRYAIRISNPLQFTKKSIILDPYILGLWLGDGSTGDSVITIGSSVEDSLLGIQKRGYMTKKVGTSIQYRVSHPDFKVKIELRNVGVLGNKHIPKTYLFSNIETRRELLRGLMDSDGTIDAKGRCEFSTTKKRLGKDVLFLIRSLGMKANMREGTATLYGRVISKRYRICFSPNFNCFSLPKKAKRYKKVRKTDIKRIFITTIEKVQTVPTKCISVDSKNHLFLAGYSLIPTHNTMFSALKIATFVQSHKDSVVYYVSPTYKQSKSIMWEMLKQIIPAHWIKKMNEQELKIECVNGARIELKGADENPDSLRGVKIDFLVCDEVAYFKNWKTVWGKVLQPTLLDSKGNAIFISSPQGYNHFYDMYVRGYEKEKDEKSEWISYKFTTYDNEYIDSLEIDKLKDEMDEDSFAQEHLAEFKKYTGLVLKYFSREKHYIPPIEFEQGFTYYRGIDFGFAKPAAVPFLAVSPDGKVFVYDLIYQAGLITPELANLIKQKSVGRHFSGTWADSAQAGDIQELQDFGISLTPVSKSVSHGAMKGESFTMYKVRKLNELIKANKLFVFNHLSEALFEIENWQYKEIREGEEIKEVPAKLNDHFIDACFRGDQLVTTINGEIPISKIKKGDLVQTSYGFFPVLNVWNNGVKQVYKYSLQFHTNTVELYCTRDHKVKTIKGWKQISQLQSGDKVYLSKHLMENPISCIQESDTLVGQIKGCTKKFGRRIMALFQRGIKYIIRMGIHGITELRILSLLSGINILESMQGVGFLRIQILQSVFMQKELSLQKFGIDQMKESSGIKSMVKKHGGQEKVKNISVLSVEKGEQQNLKQEKNIAAEPAMLVSIEETKEKKEEVFDLHIKTHHEYFAQGLLVHNCAYVVINIPSYVEPIYGEEGHKFETPAWAENAPSWSSMPDWMKRN